MSITVDGVEPARGGGAHGAESGRGQDVPLHNM